MAEPAAGAVPGPGASFWTRLRHDLGLRIEHRGWVVWFLIIERGVRGVAAAGIGVYLLVVGHDRLVGFVDTMRTQLDLTAGHHFWQGLAEDTLSRVAGISTTTVIVVSVGLLFYGAIELVESLGLLLRRRWAEYLVVIATGFGIPVEIREVVVHFTLVRAAFLVANVLIVIYLVRSKRLFQFGTEVPADER